MTSEINLRHQRQLRRWTQEQLADISGVSVRTIQRIEGGGTASLGVSAAIASAFATPARSDEPVQVPRSQHRSQVRRVTPLTVLQDIGPALEFYLGIRGTKIETGDSRCVGLKTGSNYHILATTDLVAEDFGDAARQLCGRTLPYAYVHSVHGVTQTMQDCDRLGEAVKERLSEVLVRSRGHYLIIAERRPATEGRPSGVRRRHR